MNQITLTLNSPITDEQWDMIQDVDFDYTNHILFHTKHGKDVEFVKLNKGYWIIKAINTFELAYGSTGYQPVYECSECGRVTESYLRLDEPIMPEDADFPDYCPNCGSYNGMES